MHVEDMDLRSYPYTAHANPDGESYPEPKPASNRWRIDYTDSNGYAKWQMLVGGFDTKWAEIPPEELLLAEKRMEKPAKITAVKMGLVSKQEEPGGPWVRFAPNDKDPRAELWYEGDFTELYFSKWRKKAYEGHFDALKLTRGYSETQKAKRSVEEKDAELKELQAKLLAAEQEQKRLIGKNNELMQQVKNK